MNLHELSRYYNLKQRLDQDVEILESLKQKASPCTTCPRYRRHCDQGRWRKCPVYREWFRRVWAAVTEKGGANGPV